MVSLFLIRCVKVDWYTVARFVVMDYQKTWIILDVFFAQIFKEFDDERANLCLHVLMIDVKATC